MTFERAGDGADPLRREPVAGRHEERRTPSGRLGVGTLACPECDAPVSLGGYRLSPADWIGCPYCRHTGPLRDFLSLAAPARPARVEVRLVHPAVDGRR